MLTVGGAGLMMLTRRRFTSITIGAGAGAMASTSAQSRAREDFHGIVCVELCGGSDGWNMAVPTDHVYETYRAARGPKLALQRETLVALGGTPFGLHPALKPLQYAWHHGNLNIALNAGALIAPITKSVFKKRPDLRPAGAMMHDEGTAYWRGAAAIDRWKTPDAAPSDPLSEGQGKNLRPPGNTYSERYVSRIVDACFRDPHSGKTLRSNLSDQLRQAAYQIASSRTSGVPHIVLNVQQTGYDTHTDQADPKNPAKGRLASLLGDLAASLLAFQNAITELGLARNVTVYTRSEFGRALQANDEGGTDHGWGNHHFVLGAATLPRQIFGTYPDISPGSALDLTGDGRIIPTLSIEDYIAPIARWYGLSEQRLVSTFPNPIVPENRERQRSLRS